VLRTGAVHKVNFKKTEAPLSTGIGAISAAVFALIVSAFFVVDSARIWKSLIKGAETIKYFRTGNSS
jgi:hypothetical protein